MVPGSRAPLAGSRDPGAATLRYTAGMALAWLVGGGIAAVGAGLCLWALLWDRARGRLRCPRCWYDLSGAGAAPVTCPECGRRATTTRRLRRTRRHWRVAFAAAAVTLLSGWVAPVWATKGWVACVPQPALDLTIRAFFSDEAERELATAAVGNLPEDSWKRVQASWAARRAIAGGTDEPWYSLLGPLVTARTLLEDGARHEWRGLPVELARLAERTADPATRQRVLAVLALNEVRSAAALPALWRLAAVVEDDGAVMLTFRSITRIDSRCPTPKRDADSRTRWLARELRRREVSAGVWRRMIEEAVDAGPRGIALTEEEIWRGQRAGLELAGAVGALAGRRSAGAHADTAGECIVRLLEHGDAEVRLASARAMLYVAEPGSEAEAALQRILGDPDRRVAAAAELALRWGR